MATTVNSSPREPREFIDDDELAEEAAHEDCHLLGEFEAAGMRFRVLVTRRHKLQDLTRDANDDAAANEGFTDLYRACAVGDDGRVYAVWEFYAREGESITNRSKGVDVDHRWKERGIGGKFALIMRKKLNLEWSGTYSPEGARLKDSIEAKEAAAKS